MKTDFLHALLALMLAVVGCGLAGCGNDDEPKVEDNFTTEYTFIAEFPPDLLNTADIKAYVLSPEGTLTEETITQEQNTWVLKGSDIPDKAGVMFEFDAKPNIPEGRYYVGYHIYREVRCLNNGSVVSSRFEESNNPFTITGENLPAFYGTSLILAGEVTADGVAKLTDGSDMDFGLNLGTPRPPYGSGGSF